MKIVKSRTRRRIELLFALVLANAGFQIAASGAPGIFAVTNTTAVEGNPVWITAGVTDAVSLASVTISYTTSANPVLAVDQLSGNDGDERERHQPVDWFGLRQPLDGQLQRHKSFLAGDEFKLRRQSLRFTILQRNSESRRQHHHHGQRNVLPLAVLATSSFISRRQI